MPGRTQRGPLPDDERLFGREALPRLRAALEEIRWLLGRGYPLGTAITVVGDHHQLESRQRVGLRRVACSEAQRASRARRRRGLEALRGEAARIDGFNLIITLEVALGGGVLLRGPDGALRDLAGLRGNYGLIEATDAALDLVRQELARRGAGRALWLLDAAVSSSGRLRGRILDRLGGAPFEVAVDLVPDPDALLAGAALVASSDGVILDRCESWVNLAALLVEAHVPGAWVVDLG